jgi:hypothetical protein
MALLKHGTLGLDAVGKCFRKETVSDFLRISTIEPALFMKLRREAAQTGVDMRSPTERNAADMPGSAGAVEAS